MTRDPYTSAGDPIKVGLLVDMPDAVWSVQQLGPYDHRGHKGADVMVLRRVIDGDLVMEGRYAPPLHIITGRTTHR
jgi:hypothetical protein